jgi:hypothetical protein
MKSRRRSDSVTDPCSLIDGPPDAAVSLTVSDLQLADTAAALAEWWSTRPRSSRISEDLWSRAIELAERHGIAKVTVALKLDYTSLKRRLATTTAAPTATTTLVLSDRDGRAATYRTAACGQQRHRRGRAQSVANKAVIAHQRILQERDLSRGCGGLRRVAWVLQRCRKAHGRTDLLATPDESPYALALGDAGPGRHPGRGRTAVPTGAEIRIRPAHCLVGANAQGSRLKQDERLSPTTRDVIRRNAPP